MRFTPLLVAAAGFPALVVAHGDDILARDHVEARQASTSSSSSASSAPPTTGVPPTGSVSVSGSAGGTASGSVTASNTLPMPSVSLQATNPTAVPLSSIVSNEPSAATKPLATTPAPGSTPTGVSGAPPLPNPATLSPARYPPLDRPPPTDSPEVQQWIADVKATGVNIPGFSPNSIGGCPSNTAAAADPARCWWTCGGCTRSTDITQCPTAMDWGLTYDDGPAFYTSNLLEYLDSQSLKSTFFVVGSRVISFPATVQAEYMAGHQIAVHTWSHFPLTTLTNEQIIAELGWSKKVIKDVLGVTPNMMRPPFGDIDDRVRAISLAMGLTPVMWTRISPTATFDTDDFNIHGGVTSVQQVIKNWENILGNVTTMNHGFIVLEHDLFQQSVEVATGYILPDALAHNPKFAIKPVISCLNKPLSDAYIETNDNSTNPPAFSAAVSGGVVTVTGSDGAPAPTGRSSAIGLGVSTGSLALTAIVAFVFAVSL